MKTVGWLYGNEVWCIDHEPDASGEEHAKQPLKADALVPARACLACNKIIRGRAVQDPAVDDTIPPPC